jgi:DNA-binding beta-propeller fold protein YncE
VASAALAATPGKLTQLHQLPGAGAKSGCISLNGDSEEGAGTCANGRAMQAGFTMGAVVSPDGKSVYVAVQFSGIDAFARNATSGRITQLHKLPGAGAKSGCVSTSGSSEEGGATCADGRALNGSSSLALSPDGKSVYTAAYNSDAVAAFRRG